MIKTRLAQAGTMFLPLALLALIGTTNSTAKEIATANHVCNHVHSAAVTAEKASLTNLLAQRVPSYRSSPFQGRDYLAAASEEGTYSWPADRLPIKVFMEDGRRVPGYRANFPQILANGFDAWVKATNGKLGWVQVRDRSKADVIVSWTTSTPEHQNGTEAGRTRTFTKFDTIRNHGSIYKATMTLATRLPDREMSDEEVTKTFMHEAGHAFGIAGHSPNREDIMCAKVNRNQRPVLSAADVATINRIYGSYPQCAPASVASGSSGM